MPTKPHARKRVDRNLHSDQPNTVSARSNSIKFNVGHDRGRANESPLVAALPRPPVHVIVLRDTRLMAESGLRARQPKPMDSQNTRIPGQSIVRLQLETR